MPSSSANRSRSSSRARDDLDDNTPADPLRPLSLDLSRLRVQLLPPVLQKRRQRSRAVAMKKAVSATVRRKEETTTKPRRRWKSQEMMSSEQREVEEKGGGGGWLRRSLRRHKMGGSKSHGSLLLSTATSSSSYDDGASTSSSQGANSLSGHSSGGGNNSMMRHSQAYGASAVEHNNMSFEEEKYRLRNSGLRSSQPSQQAPSLSLAHKMRGLRADVQKKFSRLRSRSAERISQRSQAQLSGRRPDLEGCYPGGEYEGGGSHHGGSKSGHILPSPVSDRAVDDYNGPFIGRARALVDYTPSPYDRDALRFKRGDTIDVITMNPSGLWKGKTGGRVGNFKFINVELLPEKPTNSKGSRNRSQSRGRVQSSHGGSASVPPRRAGSPVSAKGVLPPDGERGRVRRKRKSKNRRRLSAATMVSGGNGGGSASGLAVNGGSRPKTVDELLKRIGLEEHLSVFVLNGYEDLDSFVDMDEAELDYLGITDEQHRMKLMTAVDLLQDIATLYSGEDDDDDDDDDEDGDDLDGYGYADDTDDEHNSLEGIRLPSAATTNSEASGSSASRAIPNASGASSGNGAAAAAFQRLSFPRDSGCYASNGNLNRSSPASDRSSQSGVSSHPESGIGRSCDEDSSQQQTSSLRPSEQAAKTRSLRDRRTVNLDDLENQLDVKNKAKEPSAGGSDRNYEALLQKYTAGKTVERVNFETQFMSAKSVFERKAAGDGGEATSRSTATTPSPKKKASGSPIKMVDAM